MAVELEGLESSDDPNATQQPLDGPQTEFVLIPEDGIPLSEVVIVAYKRPESNYDTRKKDEKYWTTESTGYGYDTNGTYEQWKVLHGKPGETYTEAKIRNREEWGTYWDAKYAQWAKEAQEEYLRQKLWIFCVYFYMAEDVMMTYSGNLGLTASTARVTSKSYSFSGILSKSSDDIYAYRNFGANEYKAFRANGNKFSLKENGFGEKQFWLEEKGLDMWRGNPLFEKPFTIKIKVPKSLTEYERMLDGNRALSFDKYSLPKLNNNFKIEWIEVKPGSGFSPK